MSVAADRIFYLREFLSDVENTNRALFEKSNIKRVSLYLSGGNVHFMEQAGTRNIELPHMGTALKRLLKDHICELLFMFHVQDQKIRSGEKISQTFHISVVYKSVQIILAGRLNHPAYTLIPKTTLTPKMKPTVDYVINLD